MCGNEIVTRDAVAVQEDEVGADAGADGAVADFRKPKAAILVPYVLDRDVAALGPVAHHARGCWCRAVIGHHDLEVAVGLARQCA